MLTSLETSVSGLKGSKETSVSFYKYHIENNSGLCFRQLGKIDYFNEKVFIPSYNAFPHIAVIHGPEIILV